MIGVLIHAGTEASPALGDIVNALPRDFDAAVFVFSSTSSADLVDCLKSAARLSLCTAAEPQPLEPGRLYVAPVHFHMRVQGCQVRFLPDNDDAAGAPVALLESAAATFGRFMVGVAVDADDMVAASLGSAVNECGGQLVPGPASAESVTRSTDYSRVGGEVVAAVEEMRNRAPWPTALFRSGALGRR
jgi:chemotaxis response regulator CheB